MRRGQGFVTKIEELITEVEFARRWQNAIILLAIYRSSHVLDDAEASLETNLKPKGQKLVRIRVRSALSNIIEKIQAVRQEGDVFSIADFNQASGLDHADAYRILNLHREYFLEENIRAIFWLTKEEAQDLSTVAPDFWAFRHRLVDFTSDRATPKRSALFQGLTWVEWPWHILEDDPDKALAYREGMIKSLTNDPESIIMRADLVGEMAGLHLQKKEPRKALTLLQRGLEEIADVALPSLQARFNVALSIIFIQLSLKKEAEKCLEEAIPLGADEYHAFTLAAQLNRLMGRRTKALSLVNKDLHIHPACAFSWNECGNIYADLGRTEDALRAYEEALSLSPEHYQAALNKAALLVSVNRFDDAMLFLGKVDLPAENDLNKIGEKQGFSFLKKYLSDR